jgi:hypothetical protein
MGIYGYRLFVRPGKETMKSRYWLFFVALAVFAFAVNQSLPQTPAAGNQSKPEATEADLLAQLVSTNVDERLHAAEELDTRRYKLIQKLVAIIQGTNSDQIKLDAVTVLGQYRASEAVPVLIEHFDLDAVKSRMDRPSWEFIERSNQRGMAVTGALFFIGLPAVAPLLDKAENTDDTNIIGKCVLLCGRIEGAGATQLGLGRLLDKDTDPKRKERIESAMEMLKADKPYIKE